MPEVSYSCDPCNPWLLINFSVPAITALSAKAGPHCFNLECGAVLNESAA
jgi:hypothetical protein